MNTVLGPIARLRLARERARQVEQVPPAPIPPDQPTPVGKAVKLFGKNIRTAALLADDEKKILTSLGRKILARLRVSGQWHTPRQLAEALYLNRNSMSHSLKRLVDAGLVERRQVDPQGSKMKSGYAYRATKTK